MKRKRVEKIEALHFQEAFFYRSGNLTTRDQTIALQEVLNHFGSPLYVYSGWAIRESIRRYQKALKGLNIEIHFAMKANSNLSLLRMMKDQGLGVDLVSQGEWLRAKKAGFSPKKCVLSGVAKRPMDLKKLFESPEALPFIHVESVMEFHALVQLAEATKRTVSVAFRINPDVDAGTLDQISTGRRQDKFGVLESELVQICRSYQSHKRVNVCGLSIHIGSQIVSLKPYRKAFLSLKKTQEKVETILGRPLEYLDLGGGVGVPYQYDEQSVSLINYAKLIREVFGPKQKLMIEPGRSLVANSGVLLTKVVYVKGQGSKRIAIVDAGMNDLIRPALYGAYHEIIPLKRSAFLELKQKTKWDVVGGICESTDYFAKNRSIDLKGEPDESLAILSSGAYGAVMGSRYNSMPQIAEVLLDSGQVRLIRKAEKFNDLIRLECDKIVDF